MSIKKPLVKAIILAVLGLGGLSLLLAGCAWNGSYNSLLHGQVRRTGLFSGTKLLAMAFDPQGRLWTGAHVTDSGGMVVDTGVFVYEGEEQVQAFLGDQGPGHVTGFAFGPGGDVWAITLLGVAHLEGGAWQAYSLPGDGDWIIYPTAIAEDADGRVWVGTQDVGLYIFDGRDWLHYKRGDSGLEANFVSGIAFDSRGRAWLATRGGGVSVLDGGSWTTYRSGNSQLTSDNIYQVAVDGQDEVWLATEQGINAFDGQRWRSFGDEEYQTLLIGPDDRVWASTGIFAARIVAVEQGRLRYLPGNALLSAVDPDGNLWSLTGSVYSAGLPLVSPQAHGLHGFISSGGLIGPAIIIILLCLGIALEAWWTLAVSFGVGVLAFAASQVFIKDILNFLEIEGSGSGLVAASLMFALSMVGGLVGHLVKKRGKPNAEKVGLWLGAGLSVSLICLCSAVVFTLAVMFIFTAK